MAEASRGRWLRRPASTSLIIHARSSLLKEPPTLGRAGNKRGSVSANEGHLCLLGLDAGAGHREVLRIQVDADAVAAQGPRHGRHGAAADERVEHDLRNRGGGGTGAGGAETES